MKKILSLVLIVIFLNPIISQKFEVELSEFQKSTTSTSGLLNYSNDTGIFFHGSPFLMRNFFSTSFNGKKVKKRVKFPFKAIPYSYFKFGNRNFGLVLEKKKKERKYIGHILEFNFSGEIINDYTPNELTFSKEPYELPIYYSYDESKILILSIDDEDKKKEKISIQTFVLDSNLTIANTHHYIDEKKKSQNLTELISVRIDNEGTIYILQKHLKNENNAIKENGIWKPNYTFSLIKKTKEKEITLKIPTNENFIYNNNLFLDENQNPIVVHSWGATKDKEPEIKGFLVHYYDAKTKTMVLKEHQFTNEEVKSFGSWKHSTNVGLAQFTSVQSNYLQTKNGISFSLERKWMRSERTGNRIYNVFISDLLVVYNIDSTGNINDCLVLPKLSKNGRSSQSTDLVELNDETIGVVYLDYKKNFDKELDNFEEILRCRNGYNKHSNYNLHLAYKDDSGGLVSEIINEDGLLINLKDKIKTKNGSHIYNVANIKSGIRTDVGLLKISY